MKSIEIKKMAFAHFGLARMRAEILAKPSAIQTWGWQVLESLVVDVPASPLFVADGEKDCSGQPDIAPKSCK